MTVETRYMRSDLDTVNGQEAYKLLTTNTATGASSDYVDMYSKMGIRVWKRAADGTETELTAGTPVAQITIPAGFTTSRSATWTPPATPLEVTDNIVIRIYVLTGVTWLLFWNNTGAYNLVFHTEQLGTTILNAAEWTVTYWFVFSAMLDATWFRWGEALRPSRIDGFTYGVAVAVGQPYIKRVQYVGGMTSYGGVHS